MVATVERVASAPISARTRAGRLSHIWRFVMWAPSSKSCWLSPRMMPTGWMTICRTCAAGGPRRDDGSRSVTNFEGNVVCHRAGSGIGVHRAGVRQEGGPRVATDHRVAATDRSAGPLVAPKPTSGSSTVGGRVAMEQLPRAYPRPWRARRGVNKRRARTWPDRCWTHRWRVGTALHVNLWASSTAAGVRPGHGRSGRGGHIVNVPSAAPSRPAVPCRPTRPARPPCSCSASVLRASC